MRTTVLTMGSTLLIVHGQPVAHAVEFLKEITAKHVCYWLTTHCRGGENRAPEYLLSMMSFEAREYIDKILPTDWNARKTDAIDFSQDFRWFDDYAMEAEKEILRKNNCFDKFIRVDLKNNPDQLKNLTEVFNG
ncbi:MAG: hypothetical protein Q8P56_02595 [Candidatus Uhrbacteria bacterium]|nr:hypothetical protein [Candidatus Uhrbacteria bacterium]